MNGIRGGVNGPRALDNLAGVIDKDQVGDANAAEINRQRIHPEMISQDRVAYRDVSANAVIEAVMRKDPVGGGEALLAMQALVRHIIEFWWRGQRRVDLAAYLRVAGMHGGDFFGSVHDAGLSSEWLAVGDA